MSKIIYLQDNGIVAVLDPVLTEINTATGKNWTLEEIAKKDIPTGKKYKIVEDSDIPTDRSFRDAWTVDETDLTDGVGQ
tara:strand:- start:1411 stop:1647 length:237 start_codon:yes stop_codon:yes gene_type:complete